MDLFLTNTKLFVSQDVNSWTGVDYLWIILMFLSAVDYFDGTHSLQRIHWWASDVMLHFSKSVLMDGLGASTYSAHFHFWVNYSFKCVLTSFTLVTWCECYLSVGLFNSCCGCWWVFFNDSFPSSLNRRRHLWFFGLRFILFWCTVFFVVVILLFFFFFLFLRFTFFFLCILLFLDSTFL